MLTLKSINVAIAAAGIPLTLVKDAKGYYPFHFEGEGIDLIRTSVVYGQKERVRKVNDLPLAEWLRFASIYSAQIAEQREKIKLPDWIVVGGSVLITEGGCSRETTITRIFSDGSDIVKIGIEAGREVWLWGNGSHCAGPQLFRDRAAYDAAGAAQERMITMIDLFQKLTSEQQGSLIERANQIVG